jgi:hypothetical protein
MIKSNELRLGNYIFSKETGCNQKITGITEEHPFFDSITFDYPNWDEIEPIELSDLFLLNLGFRKKHDIFYKQSALLRFIGYGYAYSTGEIDDLDNVDYVTTINYVHQLQNLHFSLTQRELTVA